MDQTDRQNEAINIDETDELEGTGEPTPTPPAAGTTSTN